MNSISKRGIAGLLLVAAISGVAAFASYRELSTTRSGAVKAWRDIADIHEARARSARIALDQASQGGKVPLQLVGTARAMLIRADGLPGQAQLLDDPQAIDTYKRYQGELTGALFGLVFNTPVADPALEALRTELPRAEVALAQARRRYGEAAARHNALAQSVPGVAVAFFTGQRAVPPAL